MLAQYDDLFLFIDNKWIAADERKSEDIFNPATGAFIGKLPHATTEDLDLALHAASKAFIQWSLTTGNERAKILKRAAELIRERADHIAQQMTLEEGKPFAEAKGEVLVSADTFEWHGEDAKRIDGVYRATRDPTLRHLILKQPVGPVAAFTPWNFPVLTPARKMAAALAAGCTCIIKAAEETPSTALSLVRALVDAGVPSGVIQLVFGIPNVISTYLLGSPIIRKFTFTGSTLVGKQLAQMAATSMKRSTLELGGHSPVIIYEDADLDLACNLLIVGKYRNSGQVCIAPTRFYVHDRLYEKFTTMFSERAQQLKLGNGLDADTTMGPMANPRRIDAMQRLITDAVNHGGKLICGGERVGNIGYFWAPTILSDVPNSADIMNQEPFGPVAIINRFDKFEDVITEANRLEYGLASYVFTQSTRLAIKTSEALEAGMVGVNSMAVSLPESPFGGWKDSGWGVESGTAGMEAYLENKTIALGNL